MIALRRADVLLSGIRAPYLFVHQARVRLSSWRVWEASGEPPPSSYLGLFNLPFTTTPEELSSFLASFPGFLSLRMVWKTGKQWGRHSNLCNSRLWEKKGRKMETPCLGTPGNILRRFFFLSGSQLNPTLPDKQSCQTLCGKKYR